MNWTTIRMIDVYKRQVYGIYKGETLGDTYTTDKNGQFVTKEYICDNDWTVREITPSEGCLLYTSRAKRYSS